MVFLRFQISHKTWTAEVLRIKRDAELSPLFIRSKWENSAEFLNVIEILRKDRNKGHNCEENEQPKKRWSIFSSAPMLHNVQVTLTETFLCVREVLVGNLCKRSLQTKVLILGIQKNNFFKQFSLQADGK